MGYLLLLLTPYPIWLRIAVLAFVISVPVELITWFILSRIMLNKRLKKVINNPKFAEKLFINKYNKSWLIRKSNYIEKFALKYDPNIIYYIKMDELWIDNLINKHLKKDFLRVLKYAPDKGLFKCLLVVLKKKSFAHILLNWLKNCNDMQALRRLALSGHGEDFDKKEALELFLDRLDEIREMTGDPEWLSRYFAYGIITYNTAESSIRAMWEGLNDPHPLIRKTIIKEFLSDEREKLYDFLFNIISNDPVYEVRRAAWERIQKDFPEFYMLNESTLKGVQAFHVLELLRHGSKQDENFALHFLNGGDLELRLSAASFLDHIGSLQRLFISVDMGDREILDRNYNLLKKASEVNITSFLSAIESTHNPATLLIAAKILAENGNVSYITILTRKVFTLFNGKRELMELYKATLECISKRGNQNALKLMESEMQKRKNETELLEFILNAIPERDDHIFVKPLILFLKEPDFRLKLTLRNALLRMQKTLVLPELIEILKAGRESYPHKVRIEALKLMGELKLPYCMQSILENLPTLPLDEAKDFMKVFAGYPKNEYYKKIEQLLNSHDSKIRAWIISSLPATNDRGFLKQIISSLKDADPDIRIASIWALVNFDDFKSMDQIKGILRDPIERVRKEAALVLGKYGDKSTIEELNEILSDDEESIRVKKSAIEGLKVSKLLESIEILINRLEKEDQLVIDIEKALSEKKDKNEIKKIIELFKVAPPILKERITEIFKFMRGEGEELLIELYKEETEALNPFIAEILDATGFVEMTIRKLSHRNAEIRKNAAELLSLIGTKKAYKGIVFAARDPLEEVRVCVVKALEKLETKDGKDILKYLQDDPSKRVRKYTLWALEKLKAKAL